MKYFVIAFCILFIGIPAKPQDYIQPNFEELAKHEAPEWYNDAKFGIFIHWGLYSVPAWATPIGEPGNFEWEYYYKNMPYAEWYLNSLKIDGAPTQKHHAETYGKDFDYYDFIPLFNKALKKWNPDLMAGVIKQSGAQYAVLTTKHHDGFTLWPSRVSNTNFPASQPTVSRDVVGELSDAVRKKGLKMGLYYSGGLDWSFNKVPVTHLRHVFTGVPQGADYCAYVDAHYKELINSYKPDILWNDIGYPKAGDLETILANYFFQVPHGTVNNRWQRKGVFNGDFVTPEYSKLDSITPFKWETCRGIGFSFGYNRLEGPEEYLSGTEIVQLLVDIVSKNGNLLLNIGPKADGTVPAEQKQALLEVGEWLKTNGEGIYGSRPWKQFGTTTADGTEIRFTQNADAVYIFAWNYQGNQLTVPKNLLPESDQVIQMGENRNIRWEEKDENILFNLPERAETELPVCFKLKK